MFGYIVTTVACLAGAGLVSDSPGRVEGVVLDGSNGRHPLANVQVVLRAGGKGTLLPVATATTDASGRFEFRDLPVDRGMVYLCGANRDGVHFPGPRVQLRPDATTAVVTVFAYESVKAPSPLVSKTHEIDIQQVDDTLEVRESIVVSNPTPYAYVGESQGDEMPVTLRLSVPHGFQKVTFAKEFNGRHFQTADGQLTTTIPWPPGERTIEFTYRLPVEGRSQVVKRKLDLPTSSVQVSVRGDNCEQASSNLPQIESSESAVTFASSEALAANHELEIELGGLAVSWIVYGRWGALGALAILGVGTVVYARRRRPAAENKDTTKGEPARQRVDAAHGPRRGKSRRSKKRSRHSATKRRRG